MADPPDLSSDKRREARLRRLAFGMGLAVRKSRARDPKRMDFGRYRIVNVERDYVVAGGFPYGYSLGLDDVEAVLDELLASREDREIRREWAAAHGTAGAFDAKWSRDGR